MIQQPLTQDAKLLRVLGVNPFYKLVNYSWICSSNLYEKIQEKFIISIFCTTFH